MGLPSIFFAATGDIQTYFVPTTGGYLIEAGGAQAADTPDHRGDIVKGMFYLNRGDVLKIVVGCRRSPSPGCPRRPNCGGEGGSVVWRGAGETPIPARLLVSAIGGQTRPSDPREAANACTSYNAGAFQAHEPASHEGGGYVSITPIPVYARPADQASPASGHPWATWSSPGQDCPQASF